MKSENLPTIAAVNSVVFSRQRSINFRLLIFALFVFLVSPQAHFAQRNSAAAQAAFDQGNALYERGDPQSLNLALEKFGQAYDLYSRPENKSYMALARVFLGKTWKKLGDPVQALANYKDAARLYTETGNKAGQAAMFNNIGALLRDNNEFAEAINFYRQAISLLTKGGDSMDEARAYSGLADCYRFTGNLSEAVSNYQRSLSIWSTLKDNDDKVRANYGIALAYFNLGDGQNSVRYGNQALQIAQQMNEPAIIGEVLESLARINDENGEKETAVNYRLKALNVYKSAGSRVSNFSYELVVNNLADLYYRMGDLQSAEKYLRAAIRDGVRGDENPAQSYLVGTLGEVITAKGDHSEAVRVLNRGIQLAREANDRNSEAYNYASLGMAYVGISNDPQSYANARNSFERALTFFQPGENPYVEGKALAGLIFIYAWTGQRELAFQKINDVESRGLTGGKSVQTIQILHGIGLANAIFGQHNAAITYLEKAYSIAEKRKNAIEGAGLIASLANSYLQTSNFEKALKAFTQTAQINEAFGNKKMTANSFAQMGWTNLYQKNPAQARINAENAVKTAQSVADPGFRMYIGMNAFHIIAKASFAAGSYQEALSNLNQALSIAQNNNDKQSEKHFLTDLAETYQAMGNSKESKKYKKMADEIN
ncbi:MAG: tetratricopeptide repeat protein [Pyrinomonadaceae bacterium]